MMERWLPVVGYEGCYEVSNMGRVRSVPRKIVTKAGTVFSIRGKILASGIDCYGYPRVNLRMNCRMNIQRVHRLVLEAFVGPCPSGFVCRHFPDNDRTNNRLSNLSWGTQAENAADQEIHGTKLLGDKQNSSKLLPSKVIAIRRKSKAGLTQSKIAEEYGICHQTVSDIVLRKTWNHLTDLGESNEG